MNLIAWILQWLLKAAVFFTLFAFALNNQDDATVRFFFGHAWHAPMVLVVLSAFALGLLIGVLGMVPRWWRQRHGAHLAGSLPARAAAAAPDAAVPGEQDDNALGPPHGI